MEWHTPAEQPCVLIHAQLDKGETLGGQGTCLPLRQRTSASPSRRPRPTSAIICHVYTPARRGEGSVASMAKSELYVITKAKDLCSYIMTVTDKSPKRFRFGMLGDKAIGQLSGSRQLEAFGITREWIGASARHMAEEIPLALRDVLADACMAGLPGVEVLRLSMEREMGMNCKRYLNQLKGGH